MSSASAFRTDRQGEFNDSSVLTPCENALNVIQIKYSGRICKSSDESEWT